MRNLWKSPLDPSRCDNVARVDNSVNVARMDNSVNVARVDNTITEPSSTSPLTELARRSAQTQSLRRRIRAQYTVERTADAEGAVDLCRVQDLWQAFLEATRELCSPEFWCVFLSMHTSVGTTQDRVLRAVKKQYVQNDRNKFPASRRALFNKMEQVPKFWPHENHTSRIDFRAFNLPSGLSEVEFKFVTLCGLG